MLPNYSGFGQFLGVVLSVFYGKWFHYHGFTETNGRFHMPSPGGTFDATEYPYPPFDGKPRVDFGVALNIAQVEQIAGLLCGPTDTRATRIFFTAGQFYARALSSFVDGDSPYVDLVTAGEVLASYFEYSDDELLDAATRTVLDAIAAKVSEKAERLVRGRLYQVKRRYVLTLLRTLDDGFFNRTESTAPAGWMPAPKQDTIERSLKASYDIRSRHLHAGAAIGAFVRSMDGYRMERQFGEFVIDEDPDLAKTLNRAPTLIGLERIVRYALWRFAYEVILGQPSPGVTGPMLLPAPTGPGAG